MPTYTSTTSPSGLTHEGNQLKEQIVAALDRWSRCNFYGWLGAIGSGGILDWFVVRPGTHHFYASAWPLPEGAAVDQEVLAHQSAGNFLVLVACVVTILLMRMIIHGLFLRQEKEKSYMILHGLLAENNAFWTALKQVDPSTASHVIQFMGEEVTWQRPGFIDYRSSP